MSDQKTECERVRERADAEQGAACERELERVRAARTKEVKELAQRIAASPLGAALLGGAGAALPGWEKKVFDVAERLVAEGERRATEALMGPRDDGT